MESIKFDKKSLGVLTLGEKKMGTLLVKEYNKVLSKSNNEYMTGVLTAGIDVKFIAWNSSQAFKTLEMFSTEYNDEVAEVMFEVIDFAGKPTPSLSSVKLMTGVDKEEYRINTYNKKTYSTKFLNMLKNVLTTEGYNLYCEVLGVDTTEDSLWEMFISEYAAKSHHDNCPVGLLVHTYKMLGLTNFFINSYSWFGKSDFEDEVLTNKDSKEVDLIYLAVALHDIGKIFEMNQGVYQPFSYVTHREFGIEIIIPFKEKFINLYGYEGWYKIASVITQHHDKYGEPAKSLYAYVIHQIDNMDAIMTQIGQELKTGVNRDTAGSSIKLNDSRLFFE